MEFLMSKCFLIKQVVPSEQGLRGAFSEHFCRLLLYGAPFGNRKAPQRGQDIRPPLLHRRHLVGSHGMHSSQRERNHKLLQDLYQNSLPGKNMMLPSSIYPFPLVLYIETIQKNTGSNLHLLMSGRQCQYKNLAQHCSAIRYLPCPRPSCGIDPVFFCRVSCNSSIFASGTC